MRLSYRWWSCPRRQKKTIPVAGGAVSGDRRATPVVGEAILEDDGIVLLAGILHL